jgi:hypothetical protein
LAKEDSVKPVQAGPLDVVVVGIPVLLGRIPRKSNCQYSSWDRCYDFLNIFDEKLSKKIGDFDSKRS